MPLVINERPENMNWKTIKNQNIIGRLSLRKPKEVPPKIQSGVLSPQILFNPDVLILTFISRHVCW